MGNQATSPERILKLKSWMDGCPCDPSWESAELNSPGKNKASSSQMNGAWTVYQLLHIWVSWSQIGTSQEKIYLLESEIYSPNGKKA